MKLRTTTPVATETRKEEKEVATQEEIRKKEANNVVSPETGITSPTIDSNKTDNNKNINDNVVLEAGTSGQNDDNSPMPTAEVFLRFFLCFRNEESDYFFLSRNLPLILFLNSRSFLHLFLFLLCGDLFLIISRKKI